MEFITPVIGGTAHDYDDSHLVGEQLVAADDGRPVLAQAWAESGYAFLTYFFSSQGLESATVNELYDYLVSQGFTIKRDYRYTAIKLLDRAGNPCWNFTITLRESNE